MEGVSKSGLERGAAADSSPKGVSSETFRERVRGRMFIVASPDVCEPRRGEMSLCSLCRS